LYKKIAKHIILKTEIMKKSFFLLPIFLSAFFIISCERANNTDDTYTEDVAEDIAAALGSTNTGISEEIAETIAMAEEYAASSLKSIMEDTVYLVDTSYTKTSPAGSLITYSFAFEMQFGYVFSNNKLASINYNSSVEGEFDAPRLGSSESRTSEWTMTGVEITASEYILNGSSDRTGNSQSKVRNKSQVMSSSSISLSNVTVNKSTLEITGGTLSWEIDGTVNGESFAYSATIVYMGDGLAQLSLNGNTYNVDITSGDIVE